MEPALRRRCQEIRLILSDVDGVLTDGGIIIDNQGVEVKRFHVRDGMGIKLWQKAGGKFGLVTQRSSQIVKLRSAELGLEIVRQGVASKWDAVRSILREENLLTEQLCFIGDDLPDWASIGQAGLGVAVADACEELRQTAHYVTQTPGGFGAVRETVEMILKAQRRWEDLTQGYR